MKSMGKEFKTFLTNSSNKNEWYDAIEQDEIVEASKQKKQRSPIFAFLGANLFWFTYLYETFDPTYLNATTISYFI